MATTTEIQLLVTAKDQASNTLKKVGGSMESIASVGKKIATGLALASGAAVAFGIKSVGAFQESEEVSKKLEKIVLNLKGATMENVKALNMQADALKRKGVLDDDTIRSAQAQLATFDLQSKSIEKVIPGLLDMIVAEKGMNASMEDAKMAAQGLGKAFQGNFDVLSKQGFVITETQKKMIEFGNEETKVKAITQILGTTYKGVNEEMAKTTQGQLLKMKQAFGDLEKTIGGVIANALNPFIIKMTEGINAIPATFQAARASVSQFFSETSTSGVWIRDNLLPIFDQLRDTAMKAWNDIVTAIQPIKPELEFLVKIFGAALLGAIMAVIVVVAKLLESIIKAAALIISAFSTSVQIIRNLFEGFYNYFTGRNNEAVESFKKAWEGVGKFISGLFGGIKDILVNAVKPAIDLINKIIAKYNDLPGTKNMSEIRLGGKALGGSVKAGQPYIVGENGPELYVPSQSGNIIPNSPSTGSGGLVVNIINPPAMLNVQEVISQVKRAINREQELTRMGAL